jgi:hypothetical protein
MRFGSVSGRAGATLAREMLAAELVVQLLREAAATLASVAQ